MALRVEHVDRIIGHALDQQAEPLLAFPQGLLRLPALGEVAGDLGEADQIAVGIADRVDDHVSPETRAVLAHAPALGLELALAGGRLEGTLGEPAGAILFRIEPRKMLSEDFALPYSP